MENYYKTLGLKDYCSNQEEIKKAYRAQIKFFHPDLGNVSKEIAEEKTKQLNAAYEILGDQNKKQTYDSQLRYEQSYTQRNNQYYRNNAYNSNNSNSYNNSNSNGSYSNSSNSSYSNTYGYNYSSSSSSTQKDFSKQNRSYFIKFAIFLFIFLFTLGSCISSSGTSSYSSNNSNNNSTNKPSNSSSELTPVSISNGKIFKHADGERNCTFTIKTSGSYGYYIYLKDKSNSGRNDTSFYVQGGNDFTINVPEGSYQLYYASGETWYGLKNKFGPNTSYCTSDDVMTCSHEIKGDYIYYDAWTVTLYPVTNGNMSTESINESQFPG